MTIPRELTAADLEQPRPIYAVWELTLRCDHACDHCGSRADDARADELTTDELLEVADQLVRLGVREVTVIGGEAYLRADLPLVLRALADGGVHVSMQTGGLGLTPRRVERLRAAGLRAVGVSVDGPAAVHDVLRARPGSHAAAMAAIAAARDAGLPVTSNTQVNRLSKPFLREVARELEEAGVRAWRCQLTVPMGRAADRPDWILQPYEIPAVIETLAAIQLDAAERHAASGRPAREMFNVGIGNNLGYYGPHEELLRSYPGRGSAAWSGCAAGKYTLGIESDGKVKGCPSLPSAPYVGGNVRELSLQQLWDDTPELRFARDRTTDELWGFCKSCYYADVCRAGCSFTTHCTLGRRGNNPFCTYRATQLARRGVRERLVHRVAPEGLPYDFGRFELVEEPLPTD